MKQYLTSLFSQEDKNKIPNGIIALLLISSLILIALLAVKMGLSIKNGSSLNLVSGAWTAIAQDLSNGLFYRPLFSEETGYGGTRFFPLYFSLHASLIKISGMPVWSGHVLSLFAGSLLLFSFYRLLRKASVDKILAFAFIVLLLSSYSIQYGIESIRGDILPLTLNLLGLFLFLSKTPNKYKTILVATCFVLAFSAKITSISGMVALCTWLLVNDRKKEAMHIFLYTLVGYITFFLFINYASSGRVFLIFKTCASGGASWTEMIKAPLYFIGTLFAGDRPTVIFLLWGLFIFFNNIRESVKNLATYFFAVSLLITMSLYGSPGIAANHLVDVSAGALWFIAASLQFQNPQSKLGTITIGIFFLITVFLMNISGLKTELNRVNSKTSNYPIEITNLIRDAKGKVISEDPFNIVMAGKSPYILDPFMLRIITNKHKQIGLKFLNNIKNKYFSKIIFINDPLLNQERYSVTHFGRINTNAILKYYREEKRIGYYIIYSPKK